MKRYYPALDGLRGVAAVLVVIYHLEIDVANWTNIHGALAVDLFFALSGFVIANAYEKKMAGDMSLGDFVLVRFIRLYPLMLIGGAIGLCAFLIQHPGQSVWLPLAAQLTWFPLLVGSLPFPINGIQWSLTVEAVANLTHAILLRRLSIPWLVLIVALGMVGVVLTGLHFGNLTGGWSVATFWVGFVRASFSYPLGVLFFRLHSAGRLPVIKVPFFVSALALVLTIRLAAVHQLTAWGDIAAVIVVFPLIVLAGIGATESGWLRPIESWLGRLSFPLYAVHGPLLTLAVAFGYLHSWRNAAVVFVVVLIAAFLSELVDERVRGFLGKVLAPRSEPALKRPFADNKGG